MLPSFRKFKKGHSIDIEDIFIDSIIQKEHKNSIIASQKKETVIKERVFINLFLFFFAFIILMVGICFFYQLVGDDYMARAEKNKYIFKEINSGRGIIYDRNFNKIVANEQIFNLVLKGEASNEALSEVAKILNLESIEEGNTCIKENLSNQEVIVLKTKLDKLQGFELEKKNIRNYENGYAFSHIIGFLSKDEEKGQDGIEKNTKIF